MFVVPHCSLREREREREKCLEAEKMKENETSEDCLFIYLFFMLLEGLG